MSPIHRPVTDLISMLDEASLGDFDPITGPVVVYGAGTFGRTLGSLLEAGGAEIVAFVDAVARPGFPWPVLSREEIGRVPGNATAVVGIFNPAIDILPIVAWLRGEGFRKVWSPVETYRRLSRVKCPDQYWLSSLPKYLARRNEIIEGIDAFGDERSTTLYLDLWRFRLFGDPMLSRLPGASTLEEQYFPGDLPPWRSPLRLVDAGAYTGDTLLAARRRGLPLEAVAAFEPDPSNFPQLVQTLAEFPETAAAAIPCGVFGSTGQVRFAAGSGAGSAVSPEGSVVIQCVALDDCLHGFRPTLVKMDIEGAERVALEGARRLIASNRPGLAICVYHAPDHVWSIPRLLRDWDLGYTFHLRSHALQGFDTVLYAVPD